jgi:hypothetical protein
MKRFFLHSVSFLFFILALNKSSYALIQKDSVTYKPVHNFGIGIGLTYGAFGGRYVYNPSRSFGLFIGAGYNLVNISYNLGGIITIPTKSTIAPTISAMYGTNSVIKVEGMDELNGSYNGLSFGLGIKIKSRRDPGEYWDIGIIVPMRSSDFKDDYDDIKNNSAIEIKNDPWPVLINIGYNFKL